MKWFQKSEAEGRVSCQNEDKVHIYSQVFIWPYYLLGLAEDDDQQPWKFTIRFTTLDIISILEELQQYVGMRVNQVWDHWYHNQEV